MKKEDDACKDSIVSDAFFIVVLFRLQNLLHSILCLLFKFIVFTSHHCNPCFFLAYKLSNKSQIALFFSLSFDDFSLSSSSSPYIFFPNSLISISCYFFKAVFSSCKFLILASRSIILCYSCSFSNSYF